MNVNPSQPHILESIFLNAPYKCCVTDHCGTVLVMNKKMQALLRPPHPAALAQANGDEKNNKIFHFFPKKYEDFFLEIFDHQPNTLEESLDGILIDDLNQDPSIKQLRLRWYACHLPEIPSTKCFVFILHPNNEYINAEFHIQNQRAEILGYMASSIAHDFSNLLSVINGYASFIQQAIHKSDPLAADVEEILVATRLASSLTRQILTFSKTNTFQAFPHSISKIIQNMEFMIRRLLGDHITVHLQLDPHLPTVMLDSAMFEQALVNLLINARDAMPDGGQLYLKTAPLNPIPPSLPPGNYVQIAITDTGKGMDENTLQRAFDPFFSTKKHAKGMGLAIVSGIVRRCDGFIHATSTPGQGSAFVISLPCQESETGLIKQPSAANKTPSSDGITILLVENDEQVRGVAYRILNDDGYTVLLSANAGEAILTVERHKGPIHLMLSDVMMPIMNGLELADRVTRLRPNLKILLMTGSTEHIDAHHNNRPLLLKPFTADALLHQVHHLLGAP